MIFVFYFGDFLLTLFFLFSFLSFSLSGDHWSIGKTNVLSLIVRTRVLDKLYPLQQVSNVQASSHHHQKRESVVVGRVVEKKKN